MQFRRNSIVSNPQHQEGVRLGTVVNINGRYPKKGLHSNCSKELILYTMKGSGMIYQPDDQKTPLITGSVTHLKHCELYYLKGQMSLYVIHL